MILVIDEEIIMVFEAPIRYYKSKSIGWRRTQGALLQDKEKGRSSYLVCKVSVGGSSS